MFTTGNQAEATRHLQVLKAEECGADSPRSPGAQQRAEASWGGKCVAEGTRLARGTRRRSRASWSFLPGGRVGAEGCGLGARSLGVPREMLKPGRCRSSRHLSSGQGLSCSPSAGRSAGLPPREAGALQPRGLAKQGLKAGFSLLEEVSLSQHNRGVSAAPAPCLGSWAACRS